MIRLAFMLGPRAADVLGRIAGGQPPSVALAYAAIEITCERFRARSRHSQ